MRAAQPFKSVSIHLAAFALPKKRTQTLVGLETKPVQLLENARFVFGSGANAIVILHAQQHTAAGRTREAPHVDGIDHVTEVKVTGGRGGVTRQHLVYIGNSKFKIQNSKCKQ
jgi:hypothetical protein